MTSELIIFLIPSWNTLRVCGFQCVIKYFQTIWLLLGESTWKADASKTSVRGQAAKGRSLFRICLKVSDVEGRGKVLCSRKTTQSGNYNETKINILKRTIWAVWTCFLPSLSPTSICTPRHNWLPKWLSNQFCGALALVLTRQEPQQDLFNMKFVVAMAGVAEQSPGEADANTTQTTVSRAVLGHRDEVLVQIQRRRQQKKTTSAFVAFMHWVRPTGGREHQHHWVGDLIMFSSTLSTAQPFDQDLRDK